MWCPRMPVGLMEVGLLTLLAAFLGTLWLAWRTQSRAPRSAVTEDEGVFWEDEAEIVKFLLTRLIESRWSGITFKLLYRHRHYHGLMSADTPPTGDRAEAARAQVPELVSTAVARGRAAASSMGYPPISSAGIAPFRLPENDLLRPINIPTCPYCRKPMVARRNRTNAGRFWGCSEYPYCRGTRRPHDV